MMNYLKIGMNGLKALDWTLRHRTAIAAGIGGGLGAGVGGYMIRRGIQKRRERTPIGWIKKHKALIGAGAVGSALTMAPALSSDVIMYGGSIVTANKLAKRREARLQAQINGLRRAR